MIKSSKNKVGSEVNIKSIKSH